MKVKELHCNGKTWIFQLKIKVISKKISLKIQMEC